MERQLALEERMKADGIELVKKRIEQANEKGRGNTTPYAKKLITHSFEPLVAAIESAIQGAPKRGVNGKFYRFLALLPAAHLAHITLLDACTVAIGKELPNVSMTAMKIGMHIEDEIRFSRFRETHGKYVQEILDDFKRKGTQNYRYMHRVLTHKANQMSDAWIEWNSKERTHVGLILVNLLATTSDMFELRKVNRMIRNKQVTQWVLGYSQETSMWIAEYVEHVGNLTPTKLPCLIEPEDWEDLYTGGYYTPHMRRVTHLVKFSSRQHAKAISRAPMDIPRAACNAIQRTPWKINTKVLDTLAEVWKKGLGCGLPASQPLEVPPSPVLAGTDVKSLSEEEQRLFFNWKHEARWIYTEERKRVGKACQLASTLRLAREFSTEDRIFFPTQADFRGRLYAVTAGLSPQGPNFGKGVLEFAEGMPLGNGEKWWWIHGANVLGNDKVSFDDRQQYMKEHVDDWYRVAADPIGHKDIWGNADKPWQFLAWCFEVRDFCNAGDSFKSFLPMAQDGSCNGLQHFSAMLHDPVGGAATNLCDSAVPADIYQRVADVVLNKLLLDGSALAQQWLEYGIGRKLVKKPVMTMPYGSTRQTCTTSLLEHVLEHNKEAFEKPFEAAVFLTPMVWDSIGEVVVAARQAMDWLRTVGSEVAKAGMAMCWTSPAGFPVYQRVDKFGVAQARTVLMGQSARVHVMDDSQSTVDLNRMRNSSSPNFVHSCDAAHLMFTVKNARDSGIQHFACIHDDYGTHAFHTEEFNQIIRQQFFNMYNDTCVLTNLKKEIEWHSSLDLPDTPMHGTLDLGEVLKSKYFFS